MGTTAPSRTWRAGGSEGKALATKLEAKLQARRRATHVPSITDAGGAYHTDCWKASIELSTDAHLSREAIQSRRNSPGTRGIALVAHDEDVDGAGVVQGALRATGGATAMGW